MGQNRRQYKTIGRGVLNKLHPSQGKDGILKEQQQRPGIQILKWDIADDSKGWLIH